MNKFLLNNGYKRLNQINKDFSYNKWYYHKVKDVEKTAIDFYKYIETKIVTDFDTNKLVGTTHCDYNNKMWIEALGKLKRFDKNSKIDNITDNSKDLSISKFGDEYYIASGNHRLIIAKFLGLYIKKVNINYYGIDNQLYNIYNFAQTNKIEISKNEDYYIISKPLVNKRIKVRLNLFNDFMNFYISIEKGRNCYKWFDMFSIQNSNIILFDNINSFNTKKSIKFIQYFKDIV